MRFTQCRTSIMARKQNKQTKKTFKMRLKHCRWNMAKKLKNVDIEKHTLQVLYYGEKTKKRGK